MTVVLKYLEDFKEIFPLLEHTYVIAPNGTSDSVVPFAGSCCTYDDPRRLSDHPATYLHLDVMYGQNPRYFKEYLDDVRRILRFSSDVCERGDDLIDSLNLTRNSMVCVHNRRTDFVERNVATDVDKTVLAANTVALKMGTRRFLLFGDDQEFMHNLSHLIMESEKSQEGAVLISNFTEAMDLYVSSQVCRSILISAMTSTFAWWLAFFVADQNAVFYIPDNKPQGDKLPSQELLLDSWQRIWDLYD